MGWYQLLDIINDNRQRQEMERNTPPSACPNDGEPLEQGVGGTLHCRFDGWVWDGHCGW